MEGCSTTPEVQLVGSRLSGRGRLLESHRHVVTNCNRLFEWLKHAELFPIFPNLYLLSPIQVSKARSSCQGAEQALELVRTLASSSLALAFLTAVDNDGAGVLPVGWVGLSP